MAFLENMNYKISILDVCDTLYNRHKMKSKLCSVLLFVLKQKRFLVSQVHTNLWWTKINKSRVEEINQTVTIYCFYISMAVEFLTKRVWEHKNVMTSVKFITNSFKFQRIHSNFNGKSNFIWIPSY